MNKLETEAIAEDTDRSRLKQLATQNLTLRRLVAQNPAADEELLTSLASCRDKLTLKAVTANPNTPVSVLMKLGCKFPESLLSNPVFELLLLENPNFVGQMQAETLIALLSVLNVPDYIIKLAAQRTEVEVLLAVVNNPKTSREILKRLSQSKYEPIALSVLLHVNNNYEIAPQLTSKQEQILKSFLPKVTLTHNLEEELILGHLEAIPPSLLPYASKNYQKWLLNNFTTQETIKVILINSIHNAETAREKHPLYSDSPEVLKALATHDNLWLRHIVASNLNARAEVLQALASDDNLWVRGGVALNPNAPAEVLKALAVDFDSNLRGGVASNPNTPAEVLEALAVDFDSNLRGGVASNPNAPAEVLKALAVDFDSNLRGGVALNPNTPSNILEVLANDSDSRVRYSVAKNPNAPAEVLQVLASDNNLWVRYSVAKNPNAPAEVLQILAVDSDLRVRHSVALNSQTPVEILSRLSFDRSIGVRAAAAKNPQTPVEILQHLAGDRSTRVCREVAKNPNTPSHVLKSIPLNNHDSKLLTAIAQNYNTSKERAVIALLCLLLKQKTLKQNKVKQDPNYINTDILPIALKQCVRSSFSRLVVLLHTRCPKKVLDKYANSVAWMERYLVATHPNTSVYHIKRLAEDGNRFVRAAARVNLSDKL